MRDLFLFLSTCCAPWHEFLSHIIPAFEIWLPSCTICAFYLTKERIILSKIVHIDSLAFGGEGVCHLDDGRACFVAGVFPGEDVEIELTEEKRSFARGRVLNIERASEDRITPSCSLAANGRCGGCPWAQLDYEKQLKWKRQSVVDALVRIGHFDSCWVEVHVDEIKPSKHEWNYRNKVELEVGKDSSGRFL